MAALDIALVAGFALAAVALCVAAVRVLDRWLPMDEGD